MTLKKIFFLGLIIRLIVIFFSRHYTNFDLQSYLKIGESILNHKDIYPDLARFYHPYFPFFLYIESFAVILKNFHLDPVFFIKTINIIFDLACGYLVYLLSGKKINYAFIYFLNPVTILISAFHGQFDTLPLFFLLLSLYLLKKNRSVFSVLSYSFAIMIKTWPLLFFFIFIKKIRYKKLFLLIPVFPLISIFIYWLFFGDHPFEIITTISQYQSLFGVFGTGKIIFLIFSLLGFTSPPVFIQKFIFFIFLIAFTIFSISLQEKKPEKAILISLLFFYIFTPNFSIQYLSWIIPFLILIRPKLWKYLVFFMFLFLMTNYSLWIYPNIWEFFPIFSGIILWICFIFSYFLIEKNFSFPDFQLKKIFLSLILLSFLFFLTKTQVFAQETLIKYEKNPLDLSLPEDYSFVLQNHIFYEEKKFKGVFSLFNKNDNNFYLFYGESIDGINWQLKKRINTSKTISFTPRVYRKNNERYILYFSTVEDNLLKTYKILCDLEFNCFDPPQLILPPEKHYETKGVFAASHHFINNQHYLFYGSWNNGFHINLAISNDGDNWVRCENNPLLNNYDGPFLFEKNPDEFYLFFHVFDSTGIKQAKITNLNQCNITFQELGYILVPDKDYDRHHLIFPSVVKLKDNLLIFYSGLGNKGWQLNIASSKPINLKTPIILLPGFMASWNKKAVIYNQAVDISDWKLASFVHEYDGIINTMKNLDYEENQNFFIFPYDWRKSVDQTTEDLKKFIEAKIPQNTKINLIGHSLGGLVARIFTQKNKNKVNQIITVGSPHKGVIQVYKPLEAGEIDRENTFLWLTQKIILALHKKSFESDRETIQSLLPVAYDLFPTFNFLIDEKGQEISIDSLSVKNNLLANYNQSFSEIYPLFTSIFGEKGKTPNSFVIKPADPLNKLLGNYQDGQPVKTLFDSGDYTVLSKSAKEDDDAEKLIFDHGEIITKKESIKKILDILNINYDEEKITEGQKTIISPSLILFIKSPAKMEVIYHNQKFNDEDGIIFIQDAKSGVYTLNIKGLELGKYQVIIGQISENNDLWETIDGEITKSPPENQIDSYSFFYDNQTASSIFPTPSPTITPTLTPYITLTPTPTPTSTISTQSSSFSNSSVNQSQNQSTSSDNYSSSESQIPRSTGSLIASTYHPDTSLPQKEVLGIKKENPIKINKYQSKSINSNNKIITGVLTMIFIITGYFVKRKLKLF